jgi:predicted ATPase
MSAYPHWHRSPRLLEIAGPAGAGKSALRQALATAGQTSQATIWGLQVSALLRNGVELIPSFIPLWWQAKTHLWDETRHMVRLRTLQQALRATRPERDTVFDEGPVFALAWLRGFGHPVMRSQLAEQWWRVAFREWGALMDTVLVLDAPNEVLAHRIRSRPEDHEVKHFSDAEIAAWMERFRMALGWVLSGLAIEGTSVIRLDSSAARPERLAQRARSVLAGSVHVG